MLKHKIRMCNSNVILFFQVSSSDCKVTGRGESDAEAVVGLP